MFQFYWFMSLGREAMDQIRWAQDRGLKIYGETCPQYLFLTDEVFTGRGAGKPPNTFVHHRPEMAENPDALWRGIATGIFQVISSDHNAFQFDSTSGKKASGPEPHFRKVAPGIPGIERATGPGVFREACHVGRIDINYFCRHPPQTQSCQDLWPLSTQGNHCRRCRRGHRDLGSRHEADGYPGSLARRG